MASGTRNLGRTTCLAIVMAFHVDEEGEDPREFGHGVLKSIADLYSLKPPQPGDSTLLLGLGDFQCRLRLVERGTSSAFIITVNRSKGVPSRGLEEDLSAYQDGVRPLLQSLPDNPTATFSVYSVNTGSRDDALAAFNEYLAHQTERYVSLGIIRGCLLAMWGGGQRVEGTQVVERSFLLSFFKAVDAETIGSELLEDISSIASIEGEINRLYRMRQPFFRLISSAEDDTQKAIAEIVSKGFASSAKIEDLEESLKVITGRFSTLSMMAGTVRRDNITVGYMLDEVEHLLRRWNESEEEGYQTVYSMEMIRCKTLSKPFKDFIDRIESLRVDLETVLDTVRTYLSVEQQKLGIEEQKSSKSLLTRLVNLQEEVGKLEVLTVAFYITEMASLLFVVIAHDVAPLLTVIFIPLALLAASGLTRLMHTNRKK